MTTGDPYEPTNDFAIVARENAGPAYQVRSLWRGAQPAPKMFLGQEQAQRYADYLNALAQQMYPGGDARGVREPAVVKPCALQHAYIIYETHSGAIVAEAGTQEQAQEELAETRLFNPPRGGDPDPEPR